MSHLLIDVHCAPESTSEPFIPMACADPRNSCSNLCSLQDSLLGAPEPERQEDSEAAAAAGAVVVLRWGELCWVLLHLHPLPGEDGEAVQAQKGAKPLGGLDAGEPPGR